MKKFITFTNILIGLVFVSLLGIASTYADDAPSSLHISSSPDTITTSTSVDTVTFSLTTVRSAYNYEFQVNADSLSGGTTATCFLEQNADGLGSDWVAVQTVVVNGVETRSRTTGSLYYGTLRCRCIAASSTQSTAIRTDLNLSRIQ